MNKIVFCPPEGDFVQDPSLPMLKELIASQDESYWLKGSRDAGLHFEPAEHASQLILRFRKAVGFCVYYEADHAELPLVATTNPGDQELIELEESGNILKLPKSHFVPSETALKAVTEFFNTGKRLSTLQWIVFSPVE